MSKQILEAINYLTPGVTSDGQFNSANEDFGKAGQKSIVIVSDTVNLVKDLTGAGVKMGTSTIAAFSVPSALTAAQGALTVALYTAPAAYIPTVTMASGALTTALTFAIVNPLVIPAVGIGIGTLWGASELYSAAYSVGHIPLTVGHGLKNICTGTTKTFIGSVAALKEYLDANKGSFDLNTEIELISFNDEEGEKLFGFDLEETLEEFYAEDPDSIKLIIDEMKFVINEEDPLGSRFLPGFINSRIIDEYDPSEGLGIMGDPETELLS